MSTIVQQIKLEGIASYLSSAASAVSPAQYKEIFEDNKDRLYSLSFYMTGSETAAEELSASVFCRAFALSPKPTSEFIDRCLVSELREVMPIGNLTLNVKPSPEANVTRGNTKRIHLEQAVHQIAYTERLILLLHDVEGYDHARIARTLGISEDESRVGLCQARLRMRELLAQPQQ